MSLRRAWELLTKRLRNKQNYANSQSRIRPLMIEEFEGRIAMTVPGPPGGGGGGGGDPPVQLIDIDVDSDNSGAIDRTQHEEDIEVENSGKVILWNGYDDNLNSRPDYLDVPFRNAAGQLTDDPDLKKGIIAVDPPDDAPGPYKFTIAVSFVDNPLSKVRLFTSANKSDYFPGETSLPDLAAHSYDFYMEGIVTGNFVITVSLFRGGAPAGGGSTWTQVAEDAVLVTVVDFQGIGYRPYSIWSLTEIPDSEEVDPGIGIRRNGDDDDGDGKADGNLEDTSVMQDDDLIRFDIRYENGPPAWSLPPMLFNGLEVRLKTNNTDLRAWSSRDKDSEIPLDGLSHSTGSGGQMATSVIHPLLYFEWLESDLRDEVYDSAIWRTFAVDPNASATFTFELWDDVNEHRIYNDTVVFKPYESSVIVIAGENNEDFELSDPTADGTMKLAHDLYVDGWDVHIYDEDDFGTDLSNGEENEYGAKMEIKRATQRRLVSDIAMIGYSHGGGALYNISVWMVDNLSPLNPSDEVRDYKFAYAAYIDAVNQTFGFEDLRPEERRPKLVQNFDNYWQEFSWYLHGAHCVELQPPPGDLEIEYTDETHTSIDDNAGVHSSIKSRLSSTTKKF